jgi:DNA-binding NtrC family response regulator
MSINDRVILRSVVLVDAASASPACPSALHAISHKVFAAEDLSAGQGLIAQVDPDLAIVCDNIGQEQVMAFLAARSATGSSLPVVVVSDQADADKAVRFIRAGAADFLQAPLVGDKLERLLQAAGAPAQSLPDAACGTSGLQAGGQSDRFFSPHCPSGVSIIGHSGGIVKTLKTIQLVATSNCSPVLILGETGTGKELAAQAVHVLRGGGEANFVAVNCAALTAGLLESELFGHVKGAFTGADRDKTGLFELAGEGAIFLDEISEIPLELQPKLLRVLQERSFRKVGGTKDVRCRSSIIASSNRDLAEEVKAGRFRKDLYYRLAVFPIRLPALREQQRRSDIPLLAEYFVHTSGIRGQANIRGLTKPACEMLMSHDWPGNVRELKNTIERAMMLESSSQITPASIIIDLQDLPLPAGAESAGHAAKAAMDFSLAAAEREFILRALKETGWQRTRAAALLGISRATLHAKLKSYDIQIPSSSRSGAETASPACF